MCWEKLIYLLLLELNWNFTRFHYFAIITPLIWIYDSSVEVIYRREVSRYIYCIFERYLALTFLHLLNIFFLFRIIFYHVFNKFIWINFDRRKFLKVAFWPDRFICEINVLSVIMCILRYYRNFFFSGLCKYTIPIF